MHLYKVYYRDHGATSNGYVQAIGQSHANAQAVWQYGVSVYHVAHVKALR